MNESADNLNCQYALKWNNYQNFLLSSVVEHLCAENLVDITLSCEGRFIKAHKLVLSASSIYFNNLLKYHTDRHPIIYFHGLKFTTLKSLIDFIYLGEVKVPESELEKVIKIGNQLKIRGLLKNHSHKLETSLESKITPEPEVDKKTKKSSPNGKKRKMQVNIKEGNKSTSSDDLSDKDILIIDESKDSENTRDINPIGLSLDTKSITTISEQEFYKTSQKKPANAFMLFANDLRKKIQCEYPGESNKDISVRLSNLWKNLSEESKHIYYKQALDQYEPT